MPRSLLSPALVVTFLCLASLTSAAIAGVSPREAANELDKRLVCQGDTIFEVFQSVGMGDPSDGAQADITAFCRSWIDIPDTTSYVRTVTPTTLVWPRGL